MMIAARQIFLGRGAGASVPIAADYIQDGLVAMFDAIENQGWGQHTGGNGSIWRNLKDNTSYIQSFYNANFHDDYVDFVNTPGQGAAYAHYATLLPDTFMTYTVANGTFELITKVPTKETVSSYGTSGSNVISMQYKVDSGLVAAQQIAIATAQGFLSFRVGTAIRASNHFNIETYSDNKVHNFSFSAATIIVDGSTTLTPSATQSGQFAPSGNRLWGSQAQYCFFDHVCCIRFYNRLLTADEIAANYAIDKARFKLP